MKQNLMQEIRETFYDAQNRLVLQSSDLSLDSLSNMIANKSIDITPKYQRRERWSVEKQSALIESFLLNIPIPPVYLSEESFGVYTVIDGKQRLTAIHRFMTNDLKLSGLDTFTDLIGLQFSDLPEELKGALIVRPYLRVVTLLKQTDPELKYKVFTRLNRGGEPLNPQEIRNVVYRGEFNDRIVKLAENDFLRQQLKIRTDKSKAYQKMKDIEFVLRFLTLTESWLNFKGDYKDSMDYFMMRFARCSTDEISKFSDKFSRSIENCERIWGNTAFKRPSAKSSYRDHLLAGMFDAQMVAINELSDSVIAEAIKNAPKIVHATRNAFEDQRFDSSVRVATNNASNIVYRVEKMIDILTGEY